jgi:hypothetical protein
MIASSFLIFSIGFLLYAISPSYANTNEEKINTSINSPNSNTDIFTVYSNGYLYAFNNKLDMYSYMKDRKWKNGTPQFKWIGDELWQLYEDGTKWTFYGAKIKLP